MRETFNWNQSSIYIPGVFRDVPYVYRAWPIWDHIPDTGGYEQKFPNGANCHHWANELLRHHGYDAKDMFSDDFYRDTSATLPVRREHLKPFDLVMVNRQNRAYGSHIGVYAGPNLIAHLSKENGKPVLVSLDDFITEYGFYIGAKRCMLKAATAIATKPLPQPSTDLFSSRPSSPASLAPNSWS